MIEVYLTNIAEDSNGLKYTGDKVKFRVSGHAGFMTDKGDIVCAAVSAIIQTGILAIGKVAGIRQNITQKSGFLETEIEIKKASKSEVHDLLVILNTVLTGLNEIIKNYPDSTRIYFVIE